MKQKRLDFYFVFLSFVIMQPMFLHSMHRILMITVVIMELQWTLCIAFAFAWCLSLSFFSLFFQKVISILSLCCWVVIMWCCFIQWDHGCGDWSFFCSLFLTFASGWQILDMNMKGELFLDYNFTMILLWSSCPLHFRFLKSAVVCNWLFFLLSVSFFLIEWYYVF